MKVFVVEDSAAVRERIVRLLRSVPRFELAGVADTAEAAVAGITRSRPEVVTLDLGLRTGNGLQVLRAIKGMTPVPAVIVLTINDSPRHREQCLQVGADHFFSKTAEMGKVVDALVALERQGADAARMPHMTRPRTPRRKSGGASARVRPLARSVPGLPTPNAPPANTRS